MEIGKVISASMVQNCYIISDSSEAIVIDPGENDTEIISFCEKKGVHIAYIVLTHCHFDHILVAERLRQNSGAKILASVKEKENLENHLVNMTHLVGNPISLRCDMYVQDEEVVSFGNTSFRVIETPGHTSGGICIYFEKENALFSGDTLFKMSIGRTDFPSGDYSSLIDSVRNKLFVLPDETKVYPGHNDSTTIKDEKALNPYF